MNQSTTKRKLGRLLACLGCFSFLSSCSLSKQEAPALKEASISEDLKFGSANISCSQGEFEALGFALGDSVDVSFSNGRSYQDVPYYNGYYVRNSSPVLVAYPSSENILFTLNNEGIWDKASLSEDCKITVTLSEKGKYLATQEALSQSYSLDRSKYSSDEEFSNFRALKGGSLKESFIYRGASPFDNSRNRAEITDSLLKKNGIKAIVDLADGEGDMNAYKADATYSFPYSESLYDSGSVILLGMGSGYTSEPYAQSVAQGVRHMLSSSSPYYIHCMEGKDRTGFVCTLIEALAGSTYAEMKTDYMKTYENYYKVTEVKEAEKYNAIVSLYFDSFCEFLHGESDVSKLKKASYVEDAKTYLRNGGLSEEEISSFATLITK